MNDRIDKEAIADLVKDAKETAEESKRQQIEAAEKVGLPVPDDPPPSLP